MKEEGSLMRVLFCKIHSSFVCFCKPGNAHLYSSSLKLENAPNKEVVHSTFVGVSLLSSENGVLVKSCMKKKKIPYDGIDNKEIGKKRVQWMDKLGKQLAEIREFEASETGGDKESEEEISRCICIIL
ncbi:hypothetical protein ABFS82_04G226400 [Erythranthe guttata]|nr:PREDICTED: uncharacterized protein LOC105970753 [Erythranthe guttata]|eukprot:XP_012851030.1 PREDICTED: uncharacterized protein LOC105970753 [Erythranthe guttata]